MHRLRPLPLALVLALLCAAPALGDGLQERLDAQRAATAKKLEALAHWCQKKRCFGRRDEAYEALLEFEPLHERAREKLGYEKNDEGIWERLKAYKRPKNWSRSASKDAAANLAAVMREHVDGVVAALGTAEGLSDLLLAQRRALSLETRYPQDERLRPLLRDLGMRIYRATRTKGLVKEMEAAAEQLRSHYPQDLAVRGLLGEAVHGEQWLLLESARTLEERNGLQGAAKQALDGVKTEPADVPGPASKIELPWAQGVKTADLCVVGTQDAEVLLDIARKAHAAGALFHKALGREPSRRADLAIYVFKEEGEIDTFLAGYPVVDNPTLRIREKVGLDLVYADGSSLVLKGNPPEAQTDLAVNEVLNLMLADTFLASNAPKGWHAEGISRYEAWLLTGTRLSINVAGKYAGQGKDRHVPESKDPWLSMARTHVKKGVGLELLLGKAVGDYTVRDSMVAYAFAIFLLEGHEKVVGDFLDTYAKHADADRACRETLGMPRAVVEHRFTRWLDEVVAGQETGTR